MTEPPFFDSDVAMTTKMLNDLAQIVDVEPSHADCHAPGWTESLFRRIELSRKLDQFNATQPKRNPSPPSGV